VRPEPAGRADALWEAQAPLQVPAFQALLEELVETGELAAVPDATALLAPTRPVGRGERLRLEAYFRRSMVRATVRWLKHTATFEGWLDYIVHKASRHSGEEIELTDRERRWPLLFLWARVFRYLRARTGKGTPS
jgi:hypothetical protein